MTVFGGIDAGQTRFFTGQMAESNTGAIPDWSPDFDGARRLSPLFFVPTGVSYEGCRRGEDRSQASQCGKLTVASFYAALERFSSHQNTPIDGQNMAQKPIYDFWKHRPRLGRFPDTWTPEMRLALRSEFA
jgi:hypothetical protein